MLVTPAPFFLSGLAAAAHTGYAHIPSPLEKEP